MEDGRGTGFGTVAGPARRPLGAHRPAREGAPRRAPPPHGSVCRHGGAAARRVRGQRGPGHDLDADWPAGGEITSNDGHLTVSIPKGALSAPVDITIQTIAGPPAGSVGPAYEIGPEGTTFAIPALLRFEGVGAPGDGPYVVASYDGTKWVPASSPFLDASGGVAGYAPHFSLWGVMRWGCLSDANCPADTHCLSDNRCGIPCRMTSDCAFPEICNPLDGGTAGFCASRTCAFATESSGPPDLSYCNPYTCVAWYPGTGGCGTLCTSFIPDNPAGCGGGTVCSGEAGFCIRPRCFSQPCPGDQNLRGRLLLSARRGL